MESWAWTAFGPVIGYSAIMGVADSGLLSSAVASSHQQSP